ncbi:MAG: NUDIX domain-containing protein [Parvularculaceae bacterium]
MTEPVGITPQFEQKIPPEDDRERSVCVHCGFVDYRNPKIVIGSVAVWKNRILLCKRAIEPRKGFWTLPAGYLELGESVEEGARREAWEEARARLAIDRVLAVYSVPRISQVQIMFRAALLDPGVEPGLESKEVMLAAWEDIPWPDIAFPTVGWALRQYWESRGKADFPPYANPVEGL